MIHWRKICKHFAAQIYNNRMWKQTERSIWLSLFVYAISVQLPQYLLPQPGS